jgi:hypothetical protein
MIIRKVLPDDAAVYVRNHVDYWRAAYTGIIHDEYIDNMQAKEQGER